MYAQYGDSTCPLHRYLLDIGSCLGVTLWTDQGDLYDLVDVWQMWDHQFPQQERIANYVALKLLKRDTINP
ncbi:hypothetical protein SEA_GODONK_179 [Gordonia phage GodonK]|uniref:Uncharacterized protein n=1 Tax=Gordonia phage GodonK TaxID=2562192 RepID=A0A4D6E2C1_9CAUD|nr:hypothetical protein HOV33_gp189 [Gordonia phage GodonK]QBZ72767.1 hypothetical protein SEA_GODONK_179 [Gordonia phage GodonK]